MIPKFGGEAREAKDQAGGTGRSGYIRIKIGICGYKKRAPYIREKILFSPSITARPLVF
jgi:hypothetical protein